MITRPRRQNVPTTIEPHPRPPGDPVFQAAGGIQGSADSGAGMHGAFGNPSIGGAQGQVLQPQGGRQPHYYIHQPNSRLEASDPRYLPNPTESPTTYRPIDHHPLARYNFNQTHAQPLATKPPNQTVIVSYHANKGKEVTGPRGHSTDNRVSIDGEEVPFKGGRLDPEEYKMVKYKREKFFVPGKVFTMFQIQNAGETSDLSFLDGRNFTTVALGEIAHHQFRRFVVVEARPGDDFCYCCPITTYGGRATTKPGVDQTRHAIVHSEPKAPGKLPEETKMNKDPIYIIVNDPKEKLDYRSRINFGIKYPIAHNNKVKDIGNVEKSKSLPKLIQYVKAASGSAE